MARSKAKTYKAPYDRSGNLMHHPESQYVRQGDKGHAVLIDPEWRTPEPMRAVLIYEGYGRGRTAVYFIWRHSITGTRYPMFMVDFDAMMRMRTLPLQGVLATWIECKRGSNYGIRIATATEIEAQAKEVNDHERTVHAMR